ncbi:hypothetical protein FRC0409_01628 [Corynebacterium diphtheriae]|nr:hypothetical protein FRC0409_01628 [Corynebacterium diphtheriae]
MLTTLLAAAGVLASLSTSAAAWWQATRADAKAEKAIRLAEEANEISERMRLSQAIDSDAEKQKLYVDALSPELPNQKDGIRIINGFPERIHDISITCSSLETGNVGVSIMDPLERRNIKFDRRPSLLSDVKLQWVDAGGTRYEQRVPATALWEHLNL